MFFSGMLLVTGLAALIKGASFFVDGSSSLAKRLKVPGLIIGLTIVALGTSAPELAVSTSAALQGANEIALSNIVGSNIFNLLFVLGVCAIIHPVPVEAGVLKRDLPVSIISTVSVFILTSAAAIFSGQFIDMGMEEPAGSVGRAAGILLCVLFIVYIGFLISDAKKHPESDEGTKIKSWSVGKCALFIGVGIAFVVGGGQVVIYSAKEIAQILGMSETLIGFTIVAIGTSLPELVTSVVAARKGETGLAVGNVAGSNIFNLMFILGISAVIHPVEVNVASVFDMGILIAASLLTFVFLLSSKMLKRIEGIIMAGLYVADMIFAIIR